MPMPVGHLCAAHWCWKKYTVGLSTGVICIDIEPIACLQKTDTRVFQQFKKIFVAASLYQTSMETTEADVLNLDFMHSSTYKKMATIIVIGTNQIDSIVE